MNLSISNLAWEKEYDTIMYSKLKELDYSALEIAPTRIFPQNPYSCLKESKIFVKNLESDYQLKISSMQSIWFGKTERIFSSAAEREILTEYTKKAICFANVISCKNMVFGSPKNRVIQSKEDIYTAIQFFEELGEYAFKHNTVLSMEANPEIYNTNFITTTKEAFDLVKSVNNNGFKVNIDIGTMIYNKEDLSIIGDNIELVNHVHISEPYLKKIENRSLHKELYLLLREKEYKNYVSIEMHCQKDIKDVLSTMEYVRGIFI